MADSKGKGYVMAARLVDLLDPIEDFNFRHFRMRHMAAELLRLGLSPGCEAPDFELPSTDGPAAAERPARAAGAAPLHQLHVPSHPRRPGHDERASSALRRARPDRRGARPPGASRRTAWRLPFIRGEAGGRPRLQVRGRRPLARADRRLGRHSAARLRRARCCRLPDRQPGERRLLRNLGPVTGAPNRDRRPPCPRRRRRPGGQGHRPPAAFGRRDRGRDGAAPSAADAKP